MLPAVALAAWYCGLGPAIFATVLSALQAFFGFIPKIHSFQNPTASGWIVLLVFLFSCALILLMGEIRRRENDGLRASQGELEAKVLERTEDLAVVNRNLRELSARLLQLQDDERRRIARELHDSVGQMLAALGMNLSAVRTDVEHLAKTLSALHDSEDLVREMNLEVRTISHLLHPPLLDEAGLASALRWYADGFAARSKIQVDLDLSEDFERLAADVETAIFRVVQECLTNIHRHSGSPAAKISLRRSEDQVFIEVEDNGRGIPPARQLEMATSGTVGVGVRGMRERIRQLGGTLEIESSSNGTVVKVTLPITESTSGTAIAVEDPAAA